jgi:hypothetical protein
MDIHISTRRDSKFFGTSRIFGIRIRDMNGFIELAFSVPSIQLVNAFRRLMISLSRFRSDRISTQRDFVSLENFPLTHQSERSLFLHYDNAVRLGVSWKRLPNRHAATREPKNRNGEESNSHRQIIEGAPSSSLRFLERQGGDFGLNDRTSLLGAPFLAAFARSANPRCKSVGLRS